MRADKLAKQALTHTAVDFNLQKTTSDYLYVISNYTRNKWQGEWDANTTTSLHYKEVQPSVSKKCKFTYDGGRDLERCITRLRLGKCLLNHYLHVFNIHPTGLCATCAVPETVVHYLLSCADQVSLCTDLQNICMAQQLIFNLHTILNNFKCQLMIFEYISKQGRKI